MDALGWTHLTAYAALNTHSLRPSANFGPYAVLFDTGFYATAFGPAMPFLAAAMGVSLSTAGLLLTALFCGSISASAALAGFGHRTDQRLVAICGLALIAAGIAGLAVVSAWPLGLAAALVLGIGDGLTVASAHMLVASAGGDLPRSMGRLNIIFAVGAAAGPLWAGLLLAGGAGRGLVYGGMVAVPALAALALRISPRVEAQAIEAHATPASNVPLRMAPVIWVMGSILLLYVGAEFGLGTWVSSYTQKAFGAGIAAGAVVTAGYWAALGVGRIAGNWILGRGMAATMLLGFAIAGGLAASLLLVLASGIFALGVLGALLAGLCFGPIWPCALGIASQDASPRVPAILVTVGNAGGLFLPLVQGAVLDSAGPRAGMAITAGLCAAMLALLLSGQRGERALPWRPA